MLAQAEQFGARTAADGHDMELLYVCDYCLEALVLPQHAFKERGLFWALAVEVASSTKTVVISDVRRRLFVLVASFIGVSPDLSQYAS